MWRHPRTTLERPPGLDVLHQVGGVQVGDVAGGRRVESAGAQPPDAVALHRRASACAPRRPPRRARRAASSRPPSRSAPRAGPGEAGEADELGGAALGGGDERWPAARVVVDRAGGCARRRSARGGARRDARARGGRGVAASGAWRSTNRSRSRNVPSPSTLSSSEEAREVALLEQRVQRQLGRGERVAGLAAGERALGEDLDVAGLVVDVAAEPQQQLGELRVDVAAGTRPGRTARRTRSGR